MTKKTRAKPATRPVALVTADNHLQARAWHSRTTLEDDAYWAFDWMCNYAADHHIPTIVLAGDVIDKQENQAPLAEFVRTQMDFCRASEISVLFIQGQHEMQPVPWLKAVHAWPQWLHEDVDYYLQSGHRIWGIDWTPPHELPERLDEVAEDVELLVMHQVCEEWMGGITTPELSWHMVPHAKMLIVGDYHGEHTVVDAVGRDGQKLQVLCPGSTAMQSITEPPKKQFFVIHADAQNKLSLESVTIPTRHVLRPPDIHIEQQLDEFVEQVAGRLEEATERAVKEGLPDELQKPIVYVRFRQDIPDAYQRIRRAIKDQGHFFEKALVIHDDAEDAEVRAEREQVIKDGLLGALSHIAPDTTSARHIISRTLLEAEDPRKALAALRQQWIDPEEADAATV